MSNKSKKICPLYFGTEITLCSLRFFLSSSRKAHFCFPIYFKVEVTFLYHVFVIKSVPIKINPSAAAHTKHQVNADAELELEAKEIGNHHTEQIELVYGKYLTTYRSQ